MIGISACLGGVCCRYDGRMQKINLIKELIAANEAVLVCPEVMGGLPIPRVPAEIVGGKEKPKSSTRIKKMSLKALNMGRE